MRHQILDLGLEPLGAAFRPTSETYIASVEALVGATLPAAYRDFLARFGVATFRESVAARLPDGTLVDVHVFLGNDPDDAYDLRQNILALGDHHPGGLVPFATCPVGNLFCLATSAADFGGVRFLDVNAERAPWLADGFTAFLDGLKRVP